MPSTLEKSQQLVITYFSNRAVIKGIIRISFILVCLLSFIFLSQSALAANVAVKSVHVGLTPDYTRITLESNQPLQYELSMLDNPHRVILDLSNIKLSPTLAALPQKVDAIDPFVQKVRIGQFKSDVIRSESECRAAHIYGRTER
jgi:N-acetylmuramoyl-L-alanine amidase